MGLNNPSGFFSFAVALCVLLEEGLGYPPAESHLVAANSRHVRAKRCSCTNWEDKECIYFCHLDIIWINTPGHAIPYGLGNLQKRKKRSLSRCECSLRRDGICTKFCHGKPWHLSGLRDPGPPTNTELLLKLLQSQIAKPYKWNI